MHVMNDSTQAIKSPLDTYNILCTWGYITEFPALMALHVSKMMFYLWKTSLR